MKLIEILQQIHAPKGFTSIIAGLSQSDFSVLPHQKGLDATMTITEEKVALYKKRLNECQSDWAYWSILGDLEYWKAVRNILKGAELVGEDNMPEVEFKNDAVVVMDSIGKLSDFGKDVLRICEKMAETKTN